MNKKIIAGIVSGIVILVALIFGILYFTGTIKLNLKSEKETTSQTDSGKSSEKSSETSDGKGTSQNSSDSKTKNTLESRSTGKDTVEVKDATVTDNKVTVPIYATKNDGLAAARMFIDFDKNAFDYADVTPGDMFDECYSNITDGEVTIVATTKDGIYDVKGAGVIANVILIPKSGISKGEYKVTVNKEKSEYANYDAEFVKPTVETGKIIIK